MSSASEKVLAARGHLTLPLACASYVARALKDASDGLDVGLQSLAGRCDCHSSLVILES